MQGNIRIIHKHATELVWNSKTDFIPYAGEIIVYDCDDTHNYARIKIGDGVTTVIELPFSRTETAISADKLASSRLIRLAGVISGEVDFDGSSNVTLVTNLSKPLTAEFTGSSSTHTHSFVGVESSATATYTPEGTVTIEYTPKGNVSKPTTTVTPSYATVTTVTGRSSLSQYTPASYTPPTMSVSCSNETLIVQFDAGSYEPAVYVPEGDLVTTDITYLSSVDVDVDAPEFEGTNMTTTGELEGTQTTITSKFTAEGTVQEQSTTPSGTIKIKFEEDKE